MYTSPRAAQLIQSGNSHLLTIRSAVHTILPPSPGALGALSTKTPQRRLRNGGGGINDTFSPPIDFPKFRFLQDLHIIRERREERLVRSRRAKNSLVFDIVCWVKPCSPTRPLPNPATGSRPAPAFQICQDSPSDIP